MRRTSYVKSWGKRDPYGRTSDAKPYNVKVLEVRTERHPVWLCVVSTRACHTYCRWVSTESFSAQNNPLSQYYRWGNRLGNLHWLKLPLFPPIYSLFHCSLISTYVIKLALTKVTLTVILLTTFSTNSTPWLPPCRSLLFILEPLSMLIISFESLPSSACSKRSKGLRVSQLLFSAFTVLKSQLPLWFQLPWIYLSPPKLFVRH